MFIFRLFFGLIGLGLTLLLLPLKLARLPLAVILAPFSMAIHFMFRHLFFVIILIVILFIWLQFRDNKPNLPELQPATVVQETPKGSQGQPIIQLVSKKENGDSDFATDLYATMTPLERTQYSQHFYWAMSNAPDGDVHDWNYFNIAGSVRPIDTFANNQGVRCRHFTEVLKVHAIQQTLSGAACDNGGGNWCKLKINATSACGLGGQGPGFLGSITSSLKNLF